MSESEYESNTFFFAVVTSGLVYPVPGPGLDASSEYRSYSEYYGTQASFNIKKLSGPGESYQEIRVIQVSE
jgi:hypothetical protein